MKRLSVIGLGKLGSPLAAVLAFKGFEVVGADVNPALVAAINEGRAPVVEPRLQELIESGRARLKATTDIAQAVAATEATFVIVPTPSRPDGTFSLDCVLQAAEPIGRAMAGKAGYHLVVLTSTVMPGDTEARLRPALERASGKRCGVDFGLCYNPEFIALGNVINDMLRPDFILIGESDARAGAELQALYDRVCDKTPSVARMNFVNAELAKISVNSFVTMRISFANQLARLCDHLPGADVDVITGAIGLDSRIGKKYLKGAVSFGGPCFPRDNVAFARLAARLGTEAPMALATDRINHDYLDHLVGRVRACVPQRGRAALLGLSYKPDTGVTEESPSLVLAEALRAAGIAVSAYDPLAIPEARAKMGDGVRLDDSMASCVADADAVILLVPWAEFAALTPAHLKDGGQGVVVFDCWRQLAAGPFQDRGRYLNPGRTPA
jgi:UDPglucose 6-dehydrogenase